MGVASKLRQILNNFSLLRHSSGGSLSIAAMALSSMTTYLTFFDSRYTLTTAVAGVEQQVQRGTSSSNGESEVYFRRYVTPQMIISNRGTRPLVLSNVELMRSADPETCSPTDDIRTTQFTAKIVEPGTVEQIPFEFSLPPVEAVSDAEGKFTLEGSVELWCLKWTVFDPKGRRREPLSAAFTATTTYPPEGVDRNGYPNMKLDIEHSFAAERLVSRAIF